MSQIPDPITPFLEPEAKALSDATFPHPRIYEVPPEQGRQILADLQAGEGVARPEVDEEWVEVDAGQWGTVRMTALTEIPRFCSSKFPTLGRSAA